MSQEDIRRLLLELESEVSLQELSKSASRKFPNRTLHTYLHERLESMEQKGLVQSKDVNGTTKWFLTEKGKSTSLETNIDELGAIVNEKTLSKQGVKITNIVGSLDLRKKLDLGALSDDLKNTEYHPERYPSAIFRPSEDSSVTIMIHNSGKISISGAKDKQQIVQSVENLISHLQDLGIDIQATTSDVFINNIVVNFDFKRELNLEAILVGLGLERTEYEPEQFPGLIYQSSKNSTVLIFNSGKCVITGASSYGEVLSVIKEIYGELEQIGVELPVRFE